MYQLARKPGRKNSLMIRYGEQLGRIKDRNSADLAFSRGVKLRRMDALMHHVVDSSFDGIVTIREDGTIKTVNRAVQDMFGYGPEMLENQHISTLFPDLAGRRDGNSSGFGLTAGQRELTGRRHDGTAFPLELSINRTTMDQDNIYVAIVRDITERKAQQEQLEHLALHDVLTGLPNRALLSDRLTTALEFAARDKEPLSLMMLDLNLFKEVNDTLGHHIGDRVLSEVAKRLAAPLRSSDTIARVGGDEFAVLLPAVTDFDRAQRVAKRIVRALEMPFQVVDGLALEVGVSIGIALYPDHAEDAARLMQCADVAMYTAKQTETEICLYDEGQDNHSVRHLTLTGELRQAIEGKELTSYFQPKIDIQAGKVIGVEALTRWEHPVHGFVPPDEFIAQAERTGLIGPLAHWSFESTLDQLLAWQDAGLNLNMAVNLSAKNLQDESLPNMLRAMLKERKLDPASLTLEITESAIMQDPDRALAIAHDLASIGVRMSIDDFGTGYSSLAYLKNLPVDELKIDRSFVMNMNGSDGDTVIVRSTIDLAHNLGLKVVAEGIELDEHISILRDLGCDVGQGYLIGKPMDSHSFNEWIVKESRFEPARMAPSAEPVSATAS